MRPDTQRARASRPPSKIMTSIPARQLAPIPTTSNPGTLLNPQEQRNSLDHNPNILIPRKVDRRLHMLHRRHLNHILRESPPRTHALRIQRDRAGAPLRPLRQHRQRIIDPETRPPCVPHKPLTLCSIALRALVACQPGGVRPKQRTVDGFVELLPLVV